MSNNQNPSKLKQILKWTLLALILLVVLDWLLDGRLRQRLPGKRRQHGNTNPNAD